MTIQLSLAEDSVRVTDSSRQPQGEQVEAIRFTSLASEPVCSLCSGTGWRQAGNEYPARYRRCECVKARSIAARLAAIPALFREATIQSYQARNPQQERAVAFMRKLPEGSFYMSGPYGIGKTHLFYAQYREIAIAGKILGIVFSSCCFVSRSTGPATVTGSDKKYVNFWGPIRQFFEFCGIAAEL